MLELGTAVCTFRRAVVCARAGTIDVNGYLDRKVDEATHALHGLPKHELDVIRHTLRQQLSTDPGLIELVQKATGALPPSPTGEGE